MLTNLFITFGWSRDDAKWIFMQLVTVAALISSNVFDVPYWSAYLGVPISPLVLHWIMALSTFVLWVAGHYNASPLPSARAMQSGEVPGAPKLPCVFVACILGAALLSGCASVPLKERATLKLQGAESVLGTAQDAERSLCSATADKAKPVTHCDSQAAARAGLTDARHQEIARAFAAAFGVQAKAAKALLAWRSGEQVPTDVATYAVDVSAALALAKQLSGSPDVARVVDALQQATDNIAAVSAALTGGK